MLRNVQDLGFQVLLPDQGDALFRSGQILANAGDDLEDVLDPLQTLLVDKVLILLNNPPEINEPHISFGRASAVVH